MGEITPEAREIAGRYAAILESILPEQRDQEPIEWWMTATLPNDQPPPKDRLLMYPDTSASQLIPNLAHNYHQSRRNEAGGSSSSAASRHRSTIPDHQFLTLVTGTIRRARANPEIYGSRQLSNAETRALATSVLEQSESTGGASRQALQQFITGEVVRVVGHILDDIFQKFQQNITEPTNEADDEAEEEPDFTMPNPRTPIPMSMI